MHPIYVEVGDEITTVIQRLKEAPEGEVALVVPKGAVLLQSIVNLKLARKAAEEAGKELTLVTTDRVGRNLAAQVGIANISHLDPELQRQAEAAEAGAEGPEPEVIGGVRIHRYYDRTDESPEEADEAPAVEPIIPKKMMAEKAPEPQEEASPIKVKAIATDEPDPKQKPVDPAVVEIVKPKGAKAEKPEAAPLPAEHVEELTPDAKPPYHAQRPSKVLKFSAFLVLILLIAAGTVSAAYLPVTTVTVSAPGDPWTQSYDSTAAVGQEVHAPDHLAAAQLLTANASETLTFKATGTKDVGSPAKGSATVSYIQDSNPQTLPAGTTLTANGVTFTTDAAVTVPGAKVVNAVPVAGSANVSVTATAAGTSGNMSGVPASVSSSTKFYAQINSTSGGTSQTVAVVTATDIANAKNALSDKLRSDAIATLDSQKKDGQIVDDAGQSFVLDSSHATVDAGTQADSAQITGSGTEKRLVVDQSRAAAVIGAYASAGLKADTTLTVDSVSLKNLRFDLDKQTVSFTAVAAGKTTQTVPTELIRSKLAGKTLDNGASVVRGIVSGASVSISQKPAWWPLKRFPLLNRYIRVRAS